MIGGYDQADDESPKHVEQNKAYVHPLYCLWYVLPWIFRFASSNLNV